MLQPYRRNCQVTFLACLSTSGRIHREFLRLFISLVSYSSPTSSLNMAFDASYV